MKAFEKREFRFPENVSRSLYKSNPSREREGLRAFAFNRKLGLKKEVVTRVERGMLRRFDHLERANESRLTKQICRANACDGKVGKGRPRKSCADHIGAQEARRDISEIVAEGRAVRLFWVRAHAGIAGNERADELARRAALTKKTAADYDRFPLSYAKRVIRAASLEEWQERYAEGAEMTSHLAQTLTGHGGFSQYLHRFKLKDSPYCACDPAKIQDVLHVLEECPMFLRERVALETEIGVIVGRGEFPTIVEDDHKRAKFFNYCCKVVERCSKLNRN
ncbi:hypothetical protein EVAR_93803_1 [Eumeta japonica]|uniref:RNase H type-1 domain-containing protein n=1 Tax=Eumeta variegata TaxID=151549 RepID=A0A4C1VC51_EUMVA|nr:hypothetical protein EVAR_93803_1 [Eumeta japonica]